MAQAMLHEENFLTMQSQMLRQEQKDMETLLNTFTENTESQQDQNISQDDNVVPKRKRRKDYSNRRVKTRNLLTNVSYRRFKQSDFKKDNFIIEILSRLVQNFNPINLERKLDVEREQEMVKLLWDECITHDFVRYMYKIENYVVINKPNQKANNIVKKFLKEGANRMNLLKYKIEEKFKLIHYIYSLLFSKFYNRTSQFGIQNKTTFDFCFQTWKSRKQNGSVATKIVNQLSPSQAKQITIEVLSQVKNLKDYQNRDVHENEQAPTDFKIPDEAFQPTMVEIKTIDSSAKSAMDDRLIKKRAEKRKQLERQLSENMTKINKLKIKKAQ